MNDLLFCHKRDSVVGIKQPVQEASALVPSWQHPVDTSRIHLTTSIMSVQEDDGGRTVKVEVSLLVLRLPPGVPQPSPHASPSSARTAAATDPALASLGQLPDSSLKSSV